jgi:hypothetical protein
MRIIYWSEFRKNIILSIGINDLLNVFNFNFTRKINKDID